MHPPTVSTQLINVTTFIQKLPFKTTLDITNGKPTGKIPEAKVNVGIAGDSSEKYYLGQSQHAMPSVLALIESLFAAPRLSARPCVRVHLGSGCPMMDHQGTTCNPAAFLLRFRPSASFVIPPGVMGGMRAPAAHIGLNPSACRPRLQAEGVAGWPQIPAGQMSTQEETWSQSGTVI